MTTPPSDNDVFSSGFESKLDPFFKSSAQAGELDPELEATAENIEFWSRPQGPGPKINQEND